MNRGDRFVGFDLATGMDWKLQSCGGRPMEGAGACWSRATETAREFAYSEFEFDGLVHEISVRPRDNGTVEVRGHGPNYAACKVLRPPETIQSREATTSRPENDRTARYGA